MPAAAGGLLAIENAVRRVIGPLRRHAPDYVDTDDLAQEARVACWEARGNYDQGSTASLSTFLYTVGFRAGLRWIRREACLRGVPEQQWRAGAAASHEISLAALGKNFGRDELAGQVASRDCVRAFLGSLPEGERIACRQRLDGMTSIETGHVTGTHPASVRRQLMQVRHKAKEWFEL